jgi:hypothetical protein
MPFLLRQWPPPVRARRRRRTIPRHRMHEAKMPKVLDLKNSANRVEIFHFPDECPICHAHCSPECLGAYKTKDEGPKYTAVFHCPSAKCSALFLAYYETPLRSPSRCAPLTPNVRSIPEKVASVSPEGVKLLRQAEAAIAYRLPDLVGPGLRKSLEFILKDFLQKIHPDKADSIKKTALGNCVNTWVTDHNLKKAAERAVWLGNDETHYLKLWNDHDVEDLQTLLHLTLNWIDSELTLADYAKEMPEKR